MFRKLLLILVLTVLTIASSMAMDPLRIAGQASSTSVKNITLDLTIRVYDAGGTPIRTYSVSAVHFDYEGVFSFVWSAPEITYNPLYNVKIENSSNGIVLFESRLDKIVLAQSQFGALITPDEMNLAGDFQFTGSTQLGDTPADIITINGTSTFNAPTTFNDLINIKGGLDLNGDPGIAGQVLTSQGSGHPPIWEDKAMASDLTPGAGITGGIYNGSAPITFNLDLADNSLKFNTAGVDGKLQVNLANNFAWTGTNSWAGTSTFNGPVTLGNGDADDVIVNTADWTVNAAGNAVFAGTVSASNISGTNTGNVTLGTPNGLSLSGQVLSLGLATTTLNGALSSTDWNTFNSKQNALTAGTGISIVGNVISNTAPDQTVVLNGAGITVVTGTYPNFTITSTEVDGVIGNEVVNATDATLTRSGSGTTEDPYTLALNLANPNTWTAPQTFTGASPLVFDGATVGGNTTTFVITDPTGLNEITFPDKSGTVALLSDLTETNDLQSVYNATLYTTSYISAGGVDFGAGKIMDVTGGKVKIVRERNEDGNIGSALNAVVDNPDAGNSAFAASIQNVNYQDQTFTPGEEFSAIEGKLAEEAGSWYGLLGAAVNMPAQEGTIILKAGVIGTTPGRQIAGALGVSIGETEWAGYFLGNVNIMGDVTANTFNGALNGNATSADKVNHTLTAGDGITGGTFDGSLDATFAVDQAFNYNWTGNNTWAGTSTFNNTLDVTGVATFGDDVYAKKFHTKDANNTNGVEIGNSTPQHAGYIDVNGSDDTPTVVLGQFDAAGTKGSVSVRSGGVPKAAMYVDDNNNGVVGIVDGSMRAGATTNGAGLTMLEVTNSTTPMFTADELGNVYAQGTLDVHGSAKFDGTVDVKLGFTTYQNTTLGDDPTLDALAVNSIATFYGTVRLQKELLLAGSTTLAGNAGTDIPVSQGAGLPPKWTNFADMIQDLKEGHGIDITVDGKYDGSAERTVSVDQTANFDWTGNNTWSGTSDFSNVVKIHDNYLKIYNGQNLILDAGHGHGDEGYLETYSPAGTRLVTLGATGDHYDNGAVSVWDAQGNMRAGMGSPSDGIWAVGVNGNDGLQAGASTYLMTAKTFVTDGTNEVALSLGNAPTARALGPVIYVNKLGNQTFTVDLNGNTYTAGTLDVDGNTTLNANVTLGTDGTNLTTLNTPLSTSGSVGNANDIFISQGTGVAPLWISVGELLKDLKEGHGIKIADDTYYDGSKDETITVDEAAKYNWTGDNTWAGTSDFNNVLRINAHQLQIYNDLGKLIVHSGSGTSDEGYLKTQNKDGNSTLVTIGSTMAGERGAVSVGYGQTVPSGSPADWFASMVYLNKDELDYMRIPSSIIGNKWMVGTGELMSQYGVGMFYDEDTYAGAIYMFNGDFTKPTMSVDNEGVVTGTKFHAKDANNTNGVEIGNSSSQQAGYIDVNNHALIPTVVLGQSDPDGNKGAVTVRDASEAAGVIRAGLLNDPTTGDWFAGVLGSPGLIAGSATDIVTAKTFVTNGPDEVALTLGADYPDVSGNDAVIYVKHNSNYNFTVDLAGNVYAAGTLDVDGATTLNSTLDVTGVISGKSNLHLYNQDNKLIVDAGSGDNREGYLKTKSPDGTNNLVTLGATKVGTRGAVSVGYGTDRDPKNQMATMAFLPSTAEAPYIPAFPGLLADKWMIGTGELGSGKGVGMFYDEGNHKGAIYMFDAAVNGNLDFTKPTFSVDNEGVVKGSTFHTSDNDNVNGVEIGNSMDQKAGYVDVNGSTGIPTVVLGQTDAAGKLGSITVRDATTYPNVVRGGILYDATQFNMWVAGVQGMGNMAGAMSNTAGDLTKLSVWGHVGVTPKEMFYANQDGNVYAAGNVKVDGTFAFDYSPTAVDGIVTTIREIPGAEDTKLPTEKAVRNAVDAVTLQRAYDNGIAADPTGFNNRTIHTTAGPMQIRTDVADGGLDVFASANSANAIDANIVASGADQVAIIGSLQANVDEDPSDFFGGLGVKQGTMKAGVVGQTNTTYGALGATIGTSTYAGYFKGNVDVTGTLNVDGISDFNSNVHINNSYLEIYTPASTTHPIVRTGSGAKGEGYLKTTNPDGTSTIVTLGATLNGTRGAVSVGYGADDAGSNRMASMAYLDATETGLGGTLLADKWMVGTGDLTKGKGVGMFYDEAGSAAALYMFDGSFTDPTMSVDHAGVVTGTKFHAKDANNLNGVEIGISSAQKAGYIDVNSPSQIPTVVLGQSDVNGNKGAVTVRDASSNPGVIRAGLLNDPTSGNWFAGVLGNTGLIAGSSTDLLTAKTFVTNGPDEVALTLGAGNPTLQNDAVIYVKHNTDYNFTVDIDGNTHTNGTLDVDGATTLNSTLDVDGATTLNSTLDVDGATTMHNTLDVTGVISGHDYLRLYNPTNMIIEAGRGHGGEGYFETYTSDGTHRLVTLGATGTNYNNGAVSVYAPDGIMRAGMGSPADGVWAVGVNGNNNLQAGASTDLTTAKTFVKDGVNEVAMTLTGIVDLLETPVIYVNKNGTQTFGVDLDGNIYGHGDLTLDGDGLLTGEVYAKKFHTKDGNNTNGVEIGNATATKAGYIDVNGSDGNPTVVLGQFDTPGTKGSVSVRSGNNIKAGMYVDANNNGVVGVVDGTVQAGAMTDVTGLTQLAIMNGAIPEFTADENGAVYAAGTLHVVGATNLDNILDVDLATTLHSTLEVTDVITGHKNLHLMNTPEGHLIVDAGRGISGEGYLKTFSPLADNTIVTLGATLNGTRGAVSVGYGTDNTASNRMATMSYISTVEFPALTGSLLANKWMVGTGNLGALQGVGMFYDETPTTGGPAFYMFNGSFTAPVMSVASNGDLKAHELMLNSGNFRVAEDGANLPWVNILKAGKKVFEIGLGTDATPAPAGYGMNVNDDAGNLRTGMGLNGGMWTNGVVGTGYSAGAVTSGGADAMLAVMNGNTPKFTANEAGNVYAAGNLHVVGTTTLDGNVTLGDNQTADVITLNAAIKTPTGGGTVGVANDIFISQGVGNAPTWISVANLMADLTAGHGIIFATGPTYDGSVARTIEVDTTANYNWTGTHKFTGTAPVTITGGAGLDVRTPATYHDAIDAQLIDNGTATPQSAVSGMLDGATDYYGLLGAKNAMGHAGVIGSKGAAGPFGALGATVGSNDYAGYFYGNVEIANSGNLTVAGNADLNGTLDVAGQVDLGAVGTMTTVRGDFDVDGATDLDGTLNVDGISTFNNSLELKTPSFKLTLPVPVLTANYSITFPTAGPTAAKQILYTTTTSNGTMAWGLVDHNMIDLTDNYNWTGNHTFAGNVSDATDSPVGTSPHWTLNTAGDATFKGIVNLASTTTATNVLGALNVDGVVNLNDLTQSTTPTTGALIIDGGVGIAKNLNVGGLTKLTDLTVTGTLTLPLPDGKMYVGNSLGVATPVFMNGDAVLDDAGKITVSKASAGLVVTGGIMTIGTASPAATFFSVDNTTGNTNISGDLTVLAGSALNTGGTITLGNDANGVGSDDLLKVVADFEVNNGIHNVFTVDGTTGATEIHYGGDLKINNASEVQKFYVAGNTGNTTIAGTMDVTGLASFASGITKDGVGIGSPLNVSDDLTIMGSLSVNGTSSLTGATTVSGNFKVAGITTTTTLEGPTTVQAPTTLNSTLNVNGVATFHDNVGVYGIISNPSVGSPQYLQLNDADGIRMTGLVTAENGINLQNIAAPGTPATFALNGVQGAVKQLMIGQGIGNTPVWTSVASLMEDLTVGNGIKFTVGGPFDGSLASTIAVDEAASFTWTGTHSFNGPAMTIGDANTDLLTVNSTTTANEKVTVKKELIMTTVAVSAYTNLATSHATVINYSDAGHLAIVNADLPSGANVAEGQVMYIFNNTGNPISILGETVPNDNPNGNIITIMYVGGAWRAINMP